MGIVNILKKAYKRILPFHSLKKEVSNTYNNIVFSIVRQRYEYLAFHSQESGLETRKYCPEDILVSFTTYGKRIESVFLVVESIFEQTYRPNHLVLYLSDKEFNNDNLPEILKRQMKRGLEIKFVRDVRSFTKLVYAIQDYPNASIINIDDDFIYPINHLEKIIKAHIQNPDKIVAAQVKHMVFNKAKNHFTPYVEWEVPSNSYNSFAPMYLQYGAFGCLYPPHSLHKDVIKDELFLKLAPHADDLWFKVMAMLNNTEVMTLTKNWSECGITGQPHEYDSTLWRIEYVQDTALGIINVIGGKNDTQLDALCKYYNLYPQLSNIVDSVVEL